MGILNSGRVLCRGVCWIFKSLLFWGIFGVLSMKRLYFRGIGIVLGTGNSFGKPLFPNMEIMEWFALETPSCVRFFISFRDGLRENPQSHNRNNLIYFLWKNLTNLDYSDLKSTGLRFILIFKLVPFFPAFCSVSKYIRKGRN